jgi:hypothetical protein
MGDRRITLSFSLAYFSSWLSHYAASRKIARSVPDDVIDFYSVFLTFPTALGGPGGNSAS